MPYLSAYRPADRCLQHQGVSVYHVYKDDDPDQGCREFWFDTCEDSRDDGGFDVRVLAEELGDASSPLQWTDATIESIIRRGIEVGLVGSPQTRKHNRFRSANLRG